MNNHNIEREVKLNAIIDRLNAGNYTIHTNPREPNERYRIDRQTHKLLIIEAIHEANRGTLSKWINVLIALKIIEPNPHTQFWNNSSIIMPHDSTLYYINSEKLDRHTLSNCASTHEHQAANKVNSSSQ